MGWGEPSGPDERERRHRALIHAARRFLVTGTTGDRERLADAVAVAEGE